MGVRTQRRARRNARRRNWFALAPVGIIAVLLLVIIQPEPGTTSNMWVDAPEIRYALLEQPGEPLQAHTFYREVKAGDTLESILVEGGCSRSDALQLVKEFSKAIDPTQLRIGELFRFRYGSDAEIDKVALKIRGWGEITGVRQPEGFAVHAAPAEERSEELTVSGTIETTLYDTLIAAGENPLLIDRMFDVFQWDIDFFRLQKGDRFRAIVEKRYRGEDFVGYGPIIAARFDHQKESYEGFYNLSSDGTAGYFTREGRPVKKQFLKAPLKFPRITSGYTHRRFHPVLKSYRPHLAIDYGAPTGTPVMTTADGVIVHAGRARGEGNYIRVRHTRSLETWYLHLSKFAEGIRKGTKVEQGQVIGYVGSTGLSTAPHLDYRVKQDGRFINPLELRSVTPDPLDKVELARFLERVESLTARLEDFPATDTEHGTLIASNHTP